MLYFACTGKNDAKKTFIFFVASLLSFFVFSSEILRAEDTLEVQIKALTAITKAADDICRTVALEGSSQNADLSGAVKAQLNGVIAKVVDLGVQGSGSFTSDQFKNVLQKDLSATIKTESDCKQNVLKILQEKMIPPGSPIGGRTSALEPDEKLFSFLNSPPLNVRPDDLQHRKPSGEWHVDNGGRRLLSFSGFAFDMPFLYNYYSNSNNPLLFDSIVLRHESDYSLTESCTQTCFTTQAGDRDQVEKKNCGNGFEAIISRITGAFGGALEPPVKKKTDISSRVRKFERCITDPANFDCTGSGQDIIESYKFQAGSYLVSIAKYYEWTYSIVDAVSAHRTNTTSIGSCRVTIAIQLNI